GAPLFPSELFRGRRSVLGVAPADHFHVHLHRQIEEGIELAETIAVRLPHELRADQGYIHLLFRHRFSSTKNSVDCQAMNRPIIGNVKPNANHFLAIAYRYTMTNFYEAVYR